MSFLGLDVSSSVTGITLLDDAGGLVFSDSVILNTPVKRDLLDKNSQVHQQLEYISQNHKVGEIWVEDALAQCHGGKSNAHTVAVLIAMNQLVCWSCWKTFGVKPSMVSSYDARKLVSGITKGNKETGEDVKMLNLEWVAYNYPNFVIEYKSTGRVKDYILDRSDSLIIAKYGFLQFLKK